MERRNLALLCAGVLCFWLFALALGTAEGVGLRAVMHPEERAVSADIEETAEGILLPTAAAAPQLDLNCRAAILIEQGSGRVLYEKNADERREVASITKLMTALLVLEALDRDEIALTDSVQISPRAAAMKGSQALLDASAVYPLEDLLRTTIMASANDSAVALSEYIAGSEENFVDRMNRRAAEAEGVQLSLLSDYDLTGEAPSAAGTLVLGYGSLKDEACASVGETLKKVCTAAREASVTV